jgi:DNA polymerase IV
VGDAAAIRRACGHCLKRVDLTRRLRLLGVRTAGLVPVGNEPASAGGPDVVSGARGQTLPLFDDAGVETAGRARRKLA